MQPNVRLKREREQRGWSQARVAEQIGSEAVNVSRWERGFSSPSPYYREKLCLLFGKTAQELGLLDSEEDMQSFSADPLPVLPLEMQQKRAGPRFVAPSSGARIFACLSYALWWMTGLPMMLFNRDNSFVLFHSLQSSLFFGGVTIFEIVMVVLLSSFSSEVILFILTLVFALLNIIAVIAWIVGMVKAGMGVYYKLPFVGNLSEKIAITMMKQGSSQP